MYRIMCILFLLIVFNRWIFWISAFMATPLWFMHIFVLPETLRKLVGNGSGYANPTPYQWYRRRDDIEKCMTIPKDITNEVKDSMHVSKPRMFPNPLNSLKYLKEKDIAIITLYYSFQYTGLYCVLTSLTDLFSDIYKLNDLQIGLCFLSNGLGAALGSFSSGRILNWKFKKIIKSLDIDELNTKR